MNQNDDGNGTSRFDAVLARYLEALDSGAAPTRERLMAEHPRLASRLAEYFEDADRMERIAMPPSMRYTGEEPVPDETLPVGSLLGQYRLEEVVGRGGMGTIYRAVHLTLGKTVAIKVLPTRLAQDPMLVDRFKREARALARLEHPNIVAVYDLGVQGDYVHFIMEFVDGVNLRQLMETGDLTPRKALAIVPRVCEALEYAHDHGVVHRDIKPENILLDKAGKVKVADFGLARVLRGDSMIDTLTRTDVVMGTYNYMAPEQRRSSAVDHRADIYALGVVLFEMLTGEVPMGRFDRPSTRVDVDTRIDDVVMKALESEPERRYQRASEMGRDVDTVLQGPAGPAPREPRSATPPPARGAVRRVAVIVPESGKELGAGEATRVRIAVKNEQEVEVRGWSRPEVGVSLSGLKPTIEFRPNETPVKKRLFQRGEREDPDAPAWLEVGIAHASGVVYVPTDLPLEVEAPSGDLKVTGSAGPLRVLPGTGKVEIGDHRGPLVAERLKDGKLVVKGLVSDDFTLESQDGSVTVTGLELREGRGTIRTHKGRIDVGLRPDTCAFGYDLRSSTGAVHDALDGSGLSNLFGEGFRACIDSCGWGGGRSGDARNHAHGRIGAGTGRLEAESLSGDVGLHHHGQLVRRLDVEAAIRALFIALMLTGLFLWLELPLPAFIAPCFFIYRAVVSLARTRVRRV